jgi:DNA-binding HxlR family transcriptional regulator
MSATQQSAGKLIKQLIAKNGPMTTQSLFEYVPTYSEKFISKTHLKTKILKSLEGEGVLTKQVYREDPTAKPTWKWHFSNEANIEKYKNL